MELPRVRFTLRMLMIGVAVAALWSYIIAQGIAYQRRHLGGHSAWSDSP